MSPTMRDEILVRDTAWPSRPEVDRGTIIINVGSKVQMSKAKGTRRLCERTMQGKGSAHRVSVQR